MKIIAIALHATYLALADMLLAGGYIQSIAAS